MVFRRMIYGVFVKVKNIVIEGMPKICVPVVSNNHQDIITLNLIRLQSLDIGD